MPIMRRSFPSPLWLPCAISVMYHFMRFFKRFMGTSCLNYIKNLRLEKAAELLGQDRLTPLDVSLSAGFHNLSYFYREFRKKYGVTPGDFRGAGAREK